MILPLLTWNLGLRQGSIDDVDKLYKITVESSKVMRNEGVRVLTLVGLHPAEGYRLINEGWSLNEVEEFMRRSIDLAADYVKRGEAVGIGEIGRPHWSVSGDVVAMFNRVIDYAMGIARDIDAVIQLHLERGGVATAESILAMARSNGLRAYQVVMHHSQPVNVSFNYDNGLMPSIPIGRRGEFEDAVKHGPKFLVESDYFDDPGRPGGLIPPWTLVRKLKGYLAAGLIDEEFLRMICVENIGRVYGIR